MSGFAETQRDTAERDVFDLLATVRRIQETEPELLAARLSDLVMAQASLSRLVMTIRNKRAA